MVSMYEVQNIKLFKSEISFIFIYRKFGFARWTSVPDVNNFLTKVCRETLKGPCSMKASSPTDEQPGPICTIPIFKKLMNIHILCTNNNYYTTKLNLNQLGPNWKLM